MAAHRPGWHQRRLLNRAITSAERTLADLDRQIARLEAPETGVSADRSATSEVASTGTIRHDPPRYLLAELGGWPRTQTAQTVWRIAAKQINAYRAAASVSDPKTALGPVPDTPDHRAAYDAIARFLRDAAAAIDALEGPTPPDPNDDLALPGPL